MIPWRSGEDAHRNTPAKKHTSLIIKKNIFKFTYLLSVSSQFSDAHTHTHIHTLITLPATVCTRLHHQSTALLFKLFDPWSRVLSVVPLSEFQRFWDNSNVSLHILGPPQETAAEMENATMVSLPPLSLLFNQPLSVARTATVVCCLSLGKCRPKWLLCAEAQTTEI